MPETLTATRDFETDRAFAQQVTYCLDGAEQLLRKVREQRTAIIYLIRDVEKWRTANEKILHVGMCERADKMLLSLVVELAKALTKDELVAVKETCPF